MSTIWRREGEKWEALTPEGFPVEATLHEMIEEAPHTLPLIGRPELLVLGREVRLGSGIADLIAVERDGRVVIIEIKLQRNPEARRAVVSQVLAYAAELQGMTVEEFEVVLQPHLQQREWSSLQHALEATDQTGSFDRDEFMGALRTNLSEGAFRLVVVLDSAPRDLVRVAGYLERIASKVAIDLITVSNFNVGGTSIMVPERVEPERIEEEPVSTRKSPALRGTLTDGTEAFSEAISRASEGEQGRLRRLVEWAKSLEEERLCRLSTYQGVRSRWILLPRFQPENAGLVSIWNENGAALQLWRSMFERKAPASIPKVEAKIGKVIGQGNTVRDFDEELLCLLTEAYRAGAKVQRAPS